MNLNSFQYFIQRDLIMQLRNIEKCLIENQGISFSSKKIIKR